MTMLVRRPLSINHKLNTYLLELYLKTHFSCRGDKYSVPYFTQKYEYCLNAVSISIGQKQEFRVVVIEIF